MEIISLIIAFLSLCVASFALFQTHKANKFTQTLEQQRRNDEIERKERANTKNRPQLKIVSFKNNLDNPGYVENKSFDIDAIFIPYQKLDCDMDNYTKFDSFENTLDSKVYIGKQGRYKKPYCEFIDIIDKKNEWVSFEFELKNVGQSSIQSYFLLTNMEKYGGLFEVNTNFIKQVFAVGGCDYCVSDYKDIYINDKIKIRINFHKDHVISKCIEAPFFIYMQTEFNDFWRQYLFLKEDGTEQSHQTNAIEYYRNLRGYYLDAVMYDRVYWRKYNAQQKRIQRKLEKLSNKIK